MPADLNRLTEGWLELESDPGLFTLLLEDFGVRGVQVEEVYDLQKSIDGPVFGFIFLFKWKEERRCRQRVTTSEETTVVADEKTVNSIFFAQQVVPNSCATHALLSVLLNCPHIFIGPTLTTLKEYTANMNPENKGYAIGNSPELAEAHNSHATKPETRHPNEKVHGVSSCRTVETFHFVSYVPINGRLYELDGLKPYPVDHGPYGEDWTEKFREVMTERLGLATGREPYHDVRFNLMAVVPDRRIAYEQKLKFLKTNRQIVLDALKQLEKPTHPELTDDQAAVAETMESKPSSSIEDDTSSLNNFVLLSPNSIYKQSNSQDRTSNFLQPPAALDSHNYAKSPLMEGLNSDSIDCRYYEDYSGSEYSEEGDKDMNAEVSKSMAPLTIDTSSHLMKPLSIQTSFNSSPSGSSTDTSSEVGSAFNSPVQCSNGQGSPRSGKQEKPSIFDDVQNIKKFMVIRVTSGCDESASKKTPLEEGSLEEPKKLCQHPSRGVSVSMDSVLEENSSHLNEQLTKSISKKLYLIEPHQFAPKDLRALLKTVETEIEVCEQYLYDEVEKRKVYKVEDYRRTHNYDPFIYTFLFILANQGMIYDLVEQQFLVGREPGGTAGRLHKTKKPDKRRRSRPKKRK